MCCGCSATEEATSCAPESEIIVKLPTDSTVNGYRIAASADSGSQSKESTGATSGGNTASASAAARASTSGGAYRANINTKKFHTSECGYGIKISEENLYTSNSREDMISQGYEPCKRCNP